MERITSSDPMELDMIDTDAGDAPTVGMYTFQIYPY